MKIAVSEFVKRQTIESKFTHFNGTWDELRDIVEAEFENRRQAYRDGVVLVELSCPERFETSVVSIEEGIESGRIKRFETVYEPRREGEAPYSQTVAIGSKMTAKRIDVVLYRHDVLEEGNEASSDAEWEIISLNGSPIPAEVPMNNTTRARNILVAEGGTDVKLEEKSKEELIEFIKDMALSSVFWSTHTMVMPEPMKKCGYCDGEYDPTQLKSDWGFCSSECFTQSENEEK